MEDFQNALKELATRAIAATGTNVAFAAKHGLHRVTVSKLRNGRLAPGEVGPDVLQVIVEESQATDAESREIWWEWAQGRLDPRSRFGKVVASIVDEYADLMPDEAGQRLRARIIDIIADDCRARSRPKA